MFLSFFFHVIFFGEMCEISVERRGNCRSRRRCLGLRSRLIPSPLLLLLLHTLWLLLLLCVCLLCFSCCFCLHNYFIVSIGADCLEGSHAHKTTCKSAARMNIKTKTFSSWLLMLLSQAATVSPSAPKHRKISPATEKSRQFSWAQRKLCCCCFYLANSFRPWAFLQLAFLLFLINNFAT